MPLKLDIEEGGEYLLPYAQKTLRQLKDLARSLNQPSMQKQIMVGDEGRIAISTLNVAPGAELDSISISDTGGWLAITPSTDEDIAEQGLSFYNLQRRTKNITEGEAAAFSTHERVGAARQRRDRVVDMQQCYVNGQFFFVETDSDASGTTMRVVNSGGDTVQETLLADTDDATGVLTLQVAEFTFATATSAWAVAYLRRGDTPNITVRCVALSLTGEVVSVDAGTISDAALITTLAIRPLGLRDDDPHFLVAFRPTPGDTDLTVQLASGAGVTTITGFLGGQISSASSASDYGGSIVKENLDGTTEEHIEFFFSTIEETPSITPTDRDTYIYGYSTDTGLQLIDSQHSELSGPSRTSGAELRLAPHTASIEDLDRRGRLSLRDRKSGVSAYLDGHIHALVARTDYTTIGAPAYECYVATMDGAGAPIDIGGEIVGAQSVATNDSAAFVIETLPDASDSFDLRIVDNTGVVRISADSTIDVLAPFGGLLDNKRNFFLYEQDEIVLFLEYVNPLVMPATEYTVVRQIIKVIAGTTTDVGTYLDATPVFAFLDGIVVNGSAYVYAYAEDTPDTEEGSTLRLRTDDPGSDKKYLVLMNSSGEIVQTLRDDLMDYDETLDATEPTYPAVQNQFTIWNN